MLDVGNGEIYAKCGNANETPIGNMAGLVFALRDERPLRTGDLVSHDLGTTSPSAAR